MMKSLAPMALTGVVSVILWKILQIFMAPVVAWIIGVLTLGLKIVLVCLLAGLAFYGVRRVERARTDNMSEAA